MSELERHTAQQSARSGARGLKLLSIALSALTVLLLVILIPLSALISTNMGSAWLLQQVLPRVQTENRTLTIDSSLGTLLSGLNLNGIHYREGDNSVRIARLEARWNPMSLLRGEFLVDLFTAQGVEFDWSSEPTPDNASPASSDPFVAFLPLPVNITLARFRLDDANIRFDGTEIAIQSLSFASSLRDKRLLVERLRLASAPVQVSAQLTADLVAGMPIQGHVNWAYTGAITQDFENANGELSLDGSLNLLRIEHRLNAPVTMSSRGELALHLLPDGAAPSQSIELQHSIPAQFIAANSIADTQRVRIESAQISTQGSFSALDISGAATLFVEDLQNRAIAPRLRLSWASTIASDQLTITQASISTPTGSLQTHGSLRWAEPLQLSLQIDIEERDGGQYQSLLPEGVLIGALNGMAQLELTQGAAGLNGSLTIDALTGELNSYPLRVDGRLLYSDEGLTVEQLSAHSGSTILTVDGTWAQAIDFHWQLDASDLGTVSPQLAGSLNATGSIQGSPDRPQVNLSANGADLDLAGTRIARLTARGAYLNNSNNLQLDIAGIRLSDDKAQDIDTLSLAVTGLPAQHTLRLSVEAALAQGRLELSGSLLSDEQTRWQGELSNASIDSELGTWTLAEATALILSQESIRISAQCWQQGVSALCFDGEWSNDGPIAAQATLSDYPLSHFNAVTPNTTQTRLAPLLPQLPEGSRVEGTLHAAVSASGTLSPDPSSLDLAFSVNANDGQVHVDPAPTSATTMAEAPTTQTFYWSAAAINGSRKNNEWAIDSALDFYQSNLVDSGMSVQGNADALLSIRADQSLEGQLNLAFADLSWVEAFLPALQDTQGELTGLMNISGTVQAPRFSGDIALTDAAVDIPAMGLELRDISTTISSDTQQTVVIQGAAASGPGRLQFHSEILTPLSSTRAFTMALNGENFTLLNDSEILLNISPELQLRGDSEQIAISGKLSLPVIDIQISSLPESAIDVSADTVVLASDPNTPPVHNAAQSNRGFLSGTSVTAELNIALGDEARFRGFGLDAELSGALDITQRATGAPLTYGELTVEQGSYKIYGRSLDIEHGKLLFFGSLDNPALDIRAVRQAEDIKVGVQMNGTLRKISSQLFSTPTLPDSDILSVMVTGRPFAEIGTQQQDSNALMGAIANLGIKQGQSLTNQVRNQLGLDALAITSGGDTTNSSLTLGKYLTPKIFIRYGVGLFETESTLSVDYSISDRIKLEAKSGSTQSVDIKYTVER